MEDGLVRRVQAVMGDEAVAVRQDRPLVNLGVDRHVRLLQRDPVAMVNCRATQADDHAEVWLSC